jgi:hypothetical protein
MELYSLESGWPILRSHAWVQFPSKHAGAYDMHGSEHLARRVQFSLFQAKITACVLPPLFTCMPIPISLYSELLHP